MELNFEGLEIQKLYTNVMQNEISQSDIAQNEMRYSLDEKSGLFIQLSCLFSEL